MAKMEGGVAKTHCRNPRKKRGQSPQPPESLPTQEAWEVFPRMKTLESKKSFAREGGGRSLPFVEALIQEIRVQNKLLALLIASIVYRNNEEELWRVDREARELTDQEDVFVPLCPVCTVPVKQQFASERLFCPKCGREFTLKEVEPDEQN